MAGDVSALGHSGWKYRGSAWRTAILILPENNRVVIEWKKKDVQLLTKEDLTSLLDEEHGYRVVNRLREGCAIEIQQRLLADMGRVGGVANMPATFAVRVEAYSLGTDESLKQLSVPSTARDGGVCYTGRDQDSKTTIRLVLTEEVGDELLAQIGSMSDVSVHPRARATMTRLKASRSFARMLSAGLEVPEACTSKVVEIKVPGDRPEDGQTPEVVGLMLRNPSSLEGVNAQKQNAALVLVLRDVEHG
jgi:uncharacterized protein